MNLLARLVEQLAEISWQQHRLARKHTLISEAITRLRIGDAEEFVLMRLRRALEKEGPSWQDATPQQKGKA